MLQIAAAFRIGPYPIYIDHDNGIITWVSGMEIDADGAPGAYNPQDTGLDALANARDKAGHWVGLVTVNGEPYIDPATGDYVSTTAYQRPQYTVCDTHRYLDSVHIPYGVVPPEIIDAVSQIVMGSLMTVRNTANGKSALAVVGDRGPRDQIGEGSVALADLLGIPSDPRRGGISAPIIAWQIHAGIPAVINGEKFILQPSKT